MSIWRDRRLLPLAALLVWELVGRLRWVAQGALPAPSAILMQFWTDRADYPAHVLSTLSTAFLGFLIGNLIAVGCGLLFALWRPAERLMAGVNVTVFAMPTLALAPILIIALEGNTPRVVLSALSVYYPTMVATVLGLRQVDPRLTDLVRVYGGRGWAVLRWVRWRSSLPTVLSGLRVAAPASVLGSLLAEFGGGGRAGLGSYLIGSLGRGDPARLWGIGLTATAISGLAYLAVDLLARRVAGHTLSASTPVGRLELAPHRPGVGDLLMSLCAALLPFALWWGFVLWLEGRGVSPIVLRTPPQFFHDLLLADNAGQVSARLLSALGSTVPYCLLGMFAGLAFALAFAVVSTLWVGLGRALLPFALVSQSMPLVALTPLIVLIFGRGALAILAITVSVTFFPAFVTLAQGLALVPQSLLDFVRGSGGTPFTRLRLIALPWSLPYLCASARLAAPRAFLGVMIAEWLATGTGVGDLLNQARGSLEYGMVWNVAVVAVLIAVLLHQLAAGLERLVLRRSALIQD